MAKSETSKRCFIIMPITTPKLFIDLYGGDKDHFSHVLNYLFMPALKKAGFEPIPPKSKGSPVIQADIIKKLSECELVLCDMSTLNANVFFESGIRTALDKPVVLVVDNKTSKDIPFDTRDINYHEYDSSLTGWTLEKDIPKLAQHIHDAYEDSPDHNALWKVFGLTQTGEYKPEDAKAGEKIDFLIRRTSALENEMSDLKAYNVYRDSPHFIPMAKSPSQLIYGDLTNSPWNLSGRPVISSGPVDFTVGTYKFSEQELGNVNVNEIPKTQESDHENSKDDEQEATSVE